MKRYLIYVDELAPIIRMVNQGHYTNSKALELVNEICERRRLINTSVLEKAIEKWGDNVQIDKIQEEAQELALALHQYKCPTKNPIDGMTKIYDELADMRIMMAQAELLFNKDRIDAHVIRKMKKLNELVNNPN